MNTASGKFALVTGGALRLGRAMVQELARNGYNIAIHYAQSEKAAEALAHEISASGLKAITLRADLLDDAQTETLIDRAQEAFGEPLSLLINNASIFEYDNFETASRKSWDRHFQSNLRAPFILSQKFSEQAPRPYEDENGEILSQALIVNMVDQRIKKLTPEFTTYTLAKMGLWTLTQTSARALAPRIRVNAIAPGTTLRAIKQSEKQFRAQRKKSILERGANEADIQKALEFFINSPAVTGQVICVDGGQHLSWKTPDIIGEI